jgi:ATP-dependent Clp endopeptidase proteolytic subunit ClpP
MRDRKPFRGYRAFGPALNDKHDPEEDRKADNEILIFDVIGADFFGEGITAMSVMDDLRRMQGEDVTVRINSPGGDVFEGLAIHNALRRHTGKVTVVVDALAASAAAIVAVAGDVVQIVDNGTFMIHSVWTFVVGNAIELRAEASILDKIDEGLVTTFVRKTGKTAAAIRKALSFDNFMTAEEAVAFGLIDSIVEPREARNEFDLSMYKAKKTAEQRAEIADEFVDPGEDEPTVIPFDVEAAREAQKVRRARLSIFEGREKLDRLNSA